MSFVFVLGSGEWEQLGLGDNIYEVEKPRILKTLDPLIKVHQIAWGGLHTLLLTTQGKVYSWGCNDEGALGRLGPENLPVLVDESLIYPMTNITAGDCHSVAYNTSLNVIFRWGCYRNSLSGVIGKKQNIPIRIGESILENLKLTKVTSGSHHTLVLASNRVFGWGDPETGKTGRMLKSRNKNSQSLEIEAIGLKNVNDIFAGLDTSFAISTDKKNK
jgi:regulator of chromosome condensation